MDINLVLETLTPVVETLDWLGVAYRIGGSVASSLYGEFRPTQDVDIVANLESVHACPFVEQLEDNYYVSIEAVRAAILRRATFNLVSNATFMKVDVFIPKLRAFDQDATTHVKRQALLKGGREFVLASPENIIVNKLEWYEMGGRISNRQWNDILSVLKQQRTSLDLAYLNHWAHALGVNGLLAQALKEAGL